jgi:hypothetical protein
MFMTTIRRWMGLNLFAFGMATMLAVNCGGDDDGSSGTSAGSATGTGTGTGTTSGTDTGTPSGTQGGTTTGTPAGSAAGTPSGADDCTPDPNDVCEVCASEACPAEAATCCATAGCLDLVACALATGCANDPDPLACFQADTCMDEIIAAGGPAGAGTTAAQAVGNCAVAAGMAAMDGPCFECVNLMP